MQALGERNVLGQIHADEARPLGGLRLQFRHIELAPGMVRDDAVGHAILTDAGGECAGVDPRQADDAAGLQPLVEMLGGAIVGGLGHRFLDNTANDTGGGREVHRFDVLVIGAGIADMRECEGDDLPGIGGIGQHLLIAGHGGIEADFTHRLTFGTNPETFDQRTIGQHQKGGHARRFPVAEPGTRGFLHLRRLFRRHDRDSGIWRWLREGGQAVKVAMAREQS